LNLEGEKMFSEHPTRWKSLHIFGLSLLSVLGLSACAIKHTGKLVLTPDLTKAPVGGNPSYFRGDYPCMAKNESKSEQ
jgi:hypothetical protein